MGKRGHGLNHRSLFQRRSAGDFLFHIFNTFLVSSRELTAVVLREYSVYRFEKCVFDTLENPFSFLRPGSGVEVGI